VDYNEGKKYMYYLYHLPGESYMALTICNSSKVDAVSAKHFPLIDLYTVCLVSVERVSVY